jgi:hypothetical protein
VVGSCWVQSLRLVAGLVLYPVRASLFQLQQCISAEWLELVILSEAVQSTGTESAVPGWGLLADGLLSRDRYNWRLNHRQPLSPKPIATYKKPGHWAGFYFILLSLSLEKNWLPKWDAVRTPNRERLHQSPNRLHFAPRPRPCNMTSPSSLIVCNSSLMVGRLTPGHSA